MKTIKELEIEIYGIEWYESEMTNKNKLEVRELKAKLEQTKAICEMIEEDIAFWSRHGDAIVEPLKELLKKIKGEGK